MARIVLKYSTRGKDPQAEIERLLLELGVNFEKIETTTIRPGTSFKLIFLSASEEQIETLSRGLIRFPAVSLRNESEFVALQISASLAEIKNG